MFTDEELKDSAIAVLGGGAVGNTCAADCVLAGNNDVRLYELPEFYDQNGLTLDDLGIGDLDKEALLDYLNNGNI